MSRQDGLRDQGQVIFQPFARSGKKGVKDMAQRQNCGARINGPCI